jgi:hypothetical protein
MRLRKKPFRTFALAILGAAVGVMLLFVGFNSWINPLWVSPAPWTDDSFADYRPIYRHQRTGKAGIAMAQPWKAAFFGSSRVDIALDPALPQWGDQPAVNLAVSAGTLPESAPILRFTLRHAPLETAIVGIDIGDLMGPNSPYRSTGFMESPFNPQSDRFELTLRAYAGISTFETAVQTLINRNKGELPEYTPLGHRLRHQEPADVAKVIQRDSIPHALRVARRRKAIEPGEGNPWKMDLLRQMLSDTKAKNCRLVVIIPPSHASYIGVFHLEGDPDPAFRKDRAIMAKLVAESNAAHPAAPPAEVWDFNDFHPLNCEDVPRDKTRMHWWLDGTHARKSLGDVMLARIMGWPLEGPGADYGFRLTAQNLAEREQAIRDGYQRFKTESPALWQWMAEGVAGYQSTGDEPVKDDAAPGF